MSSRRAFIKGVGTATAITAVGGFGIGNVAAEEYIDYEDPDYDEDFPAINTRFHFEPVSDEEVELADNETATSYTETGDWTGFEDTDEVLIMVHGYRNSHPWALWNGEKAKKAVEYEGYDDAFTIAYSWDSNIAWNSNISWRAANESATRNGRKLAQWIRDFRDHDNRPIRILAHSLGARVVCAALDDLKPDNSDPTPGKNYVDTVGLIGPAIGNFEPQTNKQFGTGIIYSAGECYNYFSQNDPVLEGDYFLGYTGLLEEQKSPQNYEDRDATDEVDGHSQYHKAGEGCMNMFVEDMSDQRHPGRSARGKP